MKTRLAMTCMFWGCCVGLVVNELMAQGIAESGDDPASVVQIGTVEVPLLPPTLSGGQSADDQQQQILPGLRGLSFRQFARDSVVAPVRIHMRYIKDDEGNRLGHDVHLLFVVHQPLESFSEKAMEKWFAPEKESPDEAGGENPSGYIITEVSDEVVREWGLDSADETILYRRIRFDLLDRVRLDGTFQVRRSSGPHQNRIDLTLVNPADNQWSSLPEAEAAMPYSGMRGWLTATELNGGDAVLIESRFLMHEPEHWFPGANFLRSKLPLVLQEAARDLRRRMKASDAG